MIRFENKKLNVTKLLSFGFKTVGDVYEFTKNIADDQLKMTVTVYQDGALSARVEDNTFGEEYTLHLVEGAVGSFVGLVREEFGAVIKSIEGACYDSSYCMYRQTEEIVKGICEKYGTEPEFPFGEDTFVFKRGDNRKWYCIKMAVSPQRLGLDGDENIDIVNVKIDPKELERVLDNNKYFRAYHMNKKMWTTMVLDGRLSTSEILKRIDDSYKLVEKK